MIKPSKGRITMFKFIGTRDKRTYIFNVDNRNIWNWSEDYVPEGEYMISEILINGMIASSHVCVNSKSSYTDHYLSDISKKSESTPA